MKMPDKIYDFLKWFTLLFMPALVTFIGIIMNSLEINGTDIVLTIMSGFTTFLATILRISTINYKKEE